MNIFSSLLSCQSEVQLHDYEAPPPEVEATTDELLLLPGFGACDAMGTLWPAMEHGLVYDRFCPVLFSDGEVEASCAAETQRVSDEQTQLLADVVLESYSLVQLAQCEAPMTACFEYTQNTTNELETSFGLYLVPGHRMDLKSDFESSGSEALIDTSCLMSEFDVACSLEGCEVDSSVLNAKFAIKEDCSLSHSGSVFALEQFPDSLQINEMPEFDADCINNDCTLIPAQQQSLLLFGTMDQIVRSWLQQSADMSAINRECLLFDSTAGVAP